MLRRSLIVALVGVVSLGVGACGGDGDDGSGGHERHADAPQPTAIGEPGDAGASDRTVGITASDPYAFDPEEITIKTGETVTFEVTNDGGTEHEFVLGDEGFHETHGASDHGDTAFALVLEPGDTKELTWTFSEEGEVLYACHIAGHYEEGMFGTIDVS